MDPLELECENGHVGRWEVRHFLECRQPVIRADGDTLVIYRLPHAVDRGVPAGGRDAHLKCRECDATRPIPPGQQFALGG